MTFAVLARALRRSGRAALLVALISLAVGFVVATRIPPSYRSSSTVVFTASSDDAAKALRPRVPTYAALVSSQLVLDPVARAAGYEGGGEALAAHVTGVYEDSTYLTTIVVTDADAERARQLAGMVTKGFAAAVAEGFGGRLPQETRARVSVVSPPEQAVAAGGLTKLLLLAGLPVLLTLTVVGLAVAAVERERRAAEPPSDAGGAHPALRRLGDAAEVRS